jgi:hypothetical protein
LQAPPSPRRRLRTRPPRGARTRGRAATARPAGRQRT